jgi:hypothetical protein
MNATAEYTETTYYRFELVNPREAEDLYPDATSLLAIHGTCYATQEGADQAAMAAFRQSGPQLAHRIVPVTRRHIRPGQRTGEYVARHGVLPQRKTYDAVADHFVGEMQSVRLYYSDGKLQGGYWDWSEGDGIGGSAWLTPLAAWQFLAGHNCSERCDCDPHRSTTDARG